MHKNIFKLFCLVLICFMLTGCAGLHQPPTMPTSTPPTAASVSPAWQERYQQLSHIQSWVIKGSTSIQHNNRTDVATLTWTQQQRDQYHIALYGPLSLGRVTITGNPGLVTLSQTNKPTASANNLEHLMQRQLGWQIPVSNFYYWVRGIPAPSLSYRMQQDSQNRALQLMQQGWQIRYMEYMKIGPMDLPRKIELVNSRLRVRIVVRNWVI